MSDTKKTGRLLIAGTGSGCGKTSIVCGLLRAYQKRGLALAACKCGPDYIDPLFHEKVLGIPSENLDLFFHEPGMQKQLLARHSRGADLVVAEGVMGYYDGMSLESPKGSTSEIAAVLQMSVALVVPCRGMGHSVLALLKGYLEYETAGQIRAVILNGITGRTYEKLAPVLEQWLRENGHAVRLAGYLPKMADAELKSRHLGLILPEEVEELQEKLDLLAGQAEETLDLELLLQIAEEAPDLETGEQEAGEEEGTEKPKLRIAAAKDEAFCFYYKDNLELLRQLGCEIVPFSPLHDAVLPDGIDGLILAGGYPELYAKELSENVSMRESVLQSLKGGLPCLAECGGFLYLKEELEGEDGMMYPMTGFLKGRGYRTHTLGRFGYLTLEPKEELLFLKRGETIRGHEFHYWDCTENGDRCLAVKPDGQRSWECMEEKQQVFAGFAHISYDSNPAFAKRFVGCCLERREKGNAGDDMGK